MAKKNEVLLSIALEGDQEVKSKLQAVGEAGKKSLSGIEKDLGDVGKSGFGGLGESAGKLSEALAPLTEAGGLAGLAGLGGISGIFGRLTAGLLSPAGLVAGITSALLGMAKLGDETQRQKGRLKGLGDDTGFDKLTGQAKQLGTNVSDLQPRYERFIASQQKVNAENLTVTHPPNFVPGPTEETSAGVRVISGGQQVSPPSREAFQAFDRALFEQIRRDVGNADEAHRLTGQFEDTVGQKGKLIGDDIRALQKASPNAANFVTGSLSPLLGRGFSNPNELATQLDRGQAKVSATDLVNEGAKRAPEADQQAKATIGVTESFDALTGASKRLLEAFGGDAAGLAKGISSLANVIDQTAESVDRQLHAKDYQPGGSKFIGPVRSEDVQSAPKSLGEVFSSDKGDLMGRFVGFLRNTASTGTGTGAAEITGGNPFGVISDFLGKAATNPGALTEKQRPVQQEPQPAIPPGFEQLPDGTVVKSAPPAGQEQPQPAPQRQSEGESPQQVAGLSSIVQQVLESISAAAYNANKPDLKVNEPASGGIRGEGPSSGTAVADAGESITAAGDRVAAALSGVASLIDQAQSSTVKVQTAAGGGHIRHLDDGGHLSGPGTSTSDSIPAMLSDGEYVIKASSARKIGRSRLDQMNASGYAAGGDVSARRLAMVKRFASGGDASGNGVSRSVASQSTLGPGDHEITFDPTTGGAYVDGILHLPGDPLLDDPTVQQGISQSKAGMNQQPSKRKYKSDFVGRFGHSDDTDTYVKDGGPIGNWAHFAKGGSVGNVSIAPMLHLADGGAATGMGGAPIIDGDHLSAPAEALHPVTLNIGGQSIGVKATPDALKTMTGAARDAGTAQTGPRPSWYTTG